MSGLLTLKLVRTINVFCMWLRATSPCTSTPAYAFSFSSEFCNRDTCTSYYFCLHLVGLLPRPHPLYDVVGFSCVPLCVRFVAACLSCVLGSLHFFVLGRVGGLHRGHRTRKRFRQ